MANTKELIKDSEEKLENLFEAFYSLSKSGAPYPTHLVNETAHEQRNLCLLEAQLEKEKRGLDLKKLEEKLNKSLEKETDESLSNWLFSERFGSNAKREYPRIRKDHIWFAPTLIILSMTLIILLIFVYCNNLTV